MAKYNIYAVAIGRDPSTGYKTFNHRFRTWKECEPYVKGVEGARYKGFLTESEADAWVNSILDNMQDDFDNEKEQNQIKIRIPGNTLESEAKSRFVDICKSCNISPNEMVNRLIINFVSNHEFMYGTVKDKEEDDGLCPFDE